MPVVVSEVALPPQDEDDLLAAEYVLRLTDARETRLAAARIAAEPAFAGLVAAWEERLAGLLDDLADTPTDALWAAIAARLPANDDRPAIVAPSSGSAGRWRGGTFVASAVAAALLFALVTRPAVLFPPPVESPVLVATLASEAGQGWFTVSSDDGGAHLVVTPLQLTGGAHDHELWVIGDDARPRSLGLLRVDGANRLAISPAIRATLSAGATLAVSQEPIGGSPTGLPTGPVVLSGKISTL